MPIPRNWKTFLPVNKNKTQLFQLLAVELIQQTNFKQLVATKDVIIVKNIANYLLSRLIPCNHEEADTRIFVHVKEFVLKGHKVVLVDTVDMDTVVIAISCFNELSQFRLEKLWIEVGVGIDKIWIPIYDLTSVLGIKSAKLLFWYTFIGCDAVSAFAGKRKLSAWATWRVFDDITPVFEKYSYHNDHTQVKDEDIRIL